MAVTGILTAMEFHTEHYLVVVWNQCCTGELDMMRTASIPRKGLSIATT